MLGETISHYKILEKIGQGGMGEVYRAQDTTLEREVAIKVLPAAFTHDPERLARFEREAKLLASLNHPNIAAIHGLEESDGIRFLVLELVEGETLAERVAKGPLPVQEALEVCRQIAEGMEGAHEKGVIHRDLKPANVKITPEGKVKILDFGLAKAFEEETSDIDLSQSPTLTEGMTRAGVILGTAAYMSPEQAKGKAVDKRADIWAFGCVLYECLTGKRAFEGETLAETLASILKGEPDWPLLPHSVPRLLSTLLHRSLEKDPKRRLRHMGDMLILMEEARAEPSAALPAGPSLGPGPRGGTMILSLVALVGAAVGAALWTLIGASDKPPLLTRLVINPPSSAPITRYFGNDLALSPDGRLVIYRARQGGVIQLYLRSLDDLEATPIPGTERALPDFFFSSDSQSVVFQVASELKRVPLAGGPSVTLCEMPGALTGGIWEPDGTIVFSAGAHGIYRVAAAGGRPESLAVPDLDRGEVQYSHPEALPGGEAVLFSIAGGEGWQTATLSLEMREKKILVEGARQAHYAATGHLVYERAGTGTLMAVPFDLAKLEISGDSTSIQEGVRQVPSDGVDYAFSVDGTLVYVPSQALEGRRSLVWVDREGRESLVTRGDRDIAAPRLSPDGHQVAFIQMKDGSPESIWTYDLDRESFNRVTFEGIQAGTVAWSRNGKWLAYYLNEDGRRSIHRQPVDGSAQPEQLDTSDNLRIVMSWSPDGRFISFGEVGPAVTWGSFPPKGMKSLST